MSPRLPSLLLIICLLSAACTSLPAADRSVSQVPAGPTIALPACPATPVCATLPPALPTATATTEPTAQVRRSVLLVSFDGGPADTVYHLMETGVMPAFASLAETGVRAEYALSVDPSLTVPAQNSIATGAYPNRTGLVSNAFHTPVDSFYWYRTGFDELLDQAEPAWVTASRAGLKTAALFFVGGSPEMPGQAADYTVGYGIRDAYSRQETVTLGPISEDWSGEIPVSYSPPLEGWFSVYSMARVFLYALDRLDDQVTRYDTIILSTARQVQTENPRLQAGEWGPLVLSPSLVAGADFLIQNISDASPIQVTLFHSNVYHNTAAPRALLHELNQRFGFFRAGADVYALEHGWITRENQAWLIERANLWMAEVTAWLIETYQPDLTFSWQDGFDAAGHAFLMQNERQLDFSPETASELQAYYQRAAESVDQSLSILLESVNLDRTTVFLVSDHGMAPLHTVIYANRVLEQAGLLVLDRRDYVVVSKSKALAVASGGAANIYINLQNHERDGFVPLQEYAALQAQIVDLFQSVTDPATGAPVFSRVLTRSALGELHLDHIHSGDIFIQALPGYAIEDMRGAKVLFEAANYYGQHGYDSTYPEMHPFFIAAGAGIPATGEIIPPVRLVDYVPTIAQILGFPLAPTVDGQPIPILVGD